jgi:2-keto-4-pentenoate hydratase/2-oxohepta-3-ene-1,7-dioic acid hydratase in catechol pathway
MLRRVEPGDVIWMGTDGKSPHVQPGDTVEVEISVLGCLRSRFVAEQDSAQ